MDIRISSVGELLYLDINSKLIFKAHDTWWRGFYFDRFVKAIEESGMQIINHWHDSDYDYAKKTAHKCVEAGIGKFWLILTNKNIYISGIKSRNTIYLVGESGQNKEELLQKINKIYYKERNEEAIEEWNKFFNNGDVINLKCFNKTLASTLPLDVVRANGFDIVSSKRTKRLNTTALLVKVKTKMSCPDKYKGLLIGKGGKNIKALAKRHGLEYIKVL